MRNAECGIRSGGYYAGFRVRFVFVRTNVQSPLRRYSRSFALVFFEGEKCLNAYFSDIKCLLVQKLERVFYLESPLSTIDDEN